MAQWKTNEDLRRSLIVETNMEEFKKALADYFLGWELAAFLNLTTEDLISAFPDEIEDALDELQEEIGYEE